jgi:sorting nexin-25
MSLSLQWQAFNGLDGPSSSSVSSPLGLSDLVQLDDPTAMFPLTYTVVLLAVLVSLQQATTYLVPLSTLLLLVPVGLVLTLVAALPITVLLGILADRQAHRHTPGPADQRRIRLQNAFRPLTFATPAAWSVVQIKSAWETSPPLPRSTSSDSSPTQPRPAKPPIHPATPYFLLQPIDTLFARIIDEFVVSWFVKISPSPAFPNEIENTIRHSLSAILTRVENTDLPSLVVGKIIPQITSHLLSFSNAEHSLRVAGKHSSTTEGMDLFLSQAYGPNTLHPAVAGNTLDTKPAQEEHMRGLVEGILRLILPAKESRSRAVLIVAREIVTSAVLMPVLEMMSDPDFWNKMLDEKVSPINSEARHRRR